MSLISLPPCFLPSSFYYYIIYTWPAFLLSTFCWVNNVHIVLAVFPSIDWVKCSKYPVIPSLAFLSLVNNFFLQLLGIKNCGCALACSRVLMCLFRWGVRFLTQICLFTLKGIAGNALLFASRIDFFFSISFCI